MGQREVDLPQLLGDVTRTISGISNIMGVGNSQAAEKLLSDAVLRNHADAPDGSSSSSDSGSGSSGGPSVMSGLFGNTCFKACGMEDVQYAARSAGDMFISLRICVIAFTIISLMCLVAITVTVLYFTCKKSGPRRLPLPAFVRNVFPGDNNNVKSVDTTIVTPHSPQ